MTSSNGIDFTIHVNKRALQEYRQDGKIFIEGRKGSEYEIVCRNSSSIRKKVVVSVDGLNIVSGNADWDQGYVVEPWGNLVVPGWRIDNREVAKFKFSTVKSSYNQHNESGDKGNIGVIGVMVFDQFIQKTYYSTFPKTYYSTFPTFPITPIPRWPDDYYLEPRIRFLGSIGQGVFGQGLGCVETTNSIFCSGTSSISDRPRSKSREEKTSASIQNEVGTGWGKETEFKTELVSYEFETSPMTTIQIYYDSRKGLEARGINIHDGIVPRSEPKAFPGYQDGCCPRPVKTRAARKR